MVKARLPIGSFGGTYRPSRFGIEESAEINVPWGLLEVFSEIYVNPILCFCFFHPEYWNIFATYSGFNCQKYKIYLYLLKL